METRAIRELGGRSFVLHGLKDQDRQPDHTSDDQGHGDGEAFEHEFAPVK
ncbi:MAG: hypothetical protein ACU0GG_02095 [Paracoccaceae bacterium]